jgi:hypothetical protein
MIAYVFLFPILGFIFSSISIMGVVLFLLKVRKWYFYLILVFSVLLIIKEELKINYEK